MGWQEIVSIIIGAIITGFMAWLTTWLTSLIKSKVKSTKLQDYLLAALNSVNAVVGAVQQTVVDNVKNTTEWTKDTQNLILQEAVTKVKAQITEEAQLQIAETFGDFDEWVIDQVESAVQNLKTKKNP